MSADPCNPAAQRTLIPLTPGGDVRGWACSLGSSEQQLHEAVRAAGQLAEDVRQSLNNCKGRGRRVILATRAPHELMSHRQDRFAVEALAQFERGCREFSTGMARVLAVQRDPVIQAIVEDLGPPRPARRAPPAEISDRSRLAVGRK